MKRALIATATAFSLALFIAFAFVLVRTWWYEDTFYYTHEHGPKDALITNDHRLILARATVSSGSDDEPIGFHYSAAPTTKPTEWDSIVAIRKWRFAGFEYQ